MYFFKLFKHFLWRSELPETLSQNSWIADLNIILRTWIWKNARAWYLWWMACVALRHLAHTYIHTICHRLRRHLQWPILFAIDLGATYNARYYGEQYMIILYDLWIDIMHVLIMARVDRCLQCMCVPRKHWNAVFKQIYPKITKV